MRAACDRYDPSAEGRMVMFAATRGFQVALGLLGVAWAAMGCRSQSDFYARSLVAHTSIPGEVWLASLGSEKRLLADGRIDATRRIQTAEDVTIDLWILKARGVDPGGSRGTAVLFHGLTESRAQMYYVGQRLADRGFDVILPDLRAHSRSTGTYSTFGPAEAADLDKVTDTLLAEGEVHGPVFAVGASLGGAAAVHLGAMREDCRGVVAMAPVGDVRRILHRLLLAYAPLMDAETANETIDRAGELAGFDVDEAAGVIAARKLRCPLLVVHGWLDAAVPIQHGRMVHRAAGGPKRLEVVGWAGHTGILMGRADWIARQVDEMARGEFRTDAVQESDK